MNLLFVGKNHAEQKSILIDALRLKGDEVISWNNSDRWWVRIYRLFTLSRSIDAVILWQAGYLEKHFAYIWSPVVLFLEIIFYKLLNMRIIYRATGWDLRIPSRSSKIYEISNIEKAGNDPFRYTNRHVLELRMSLVEWLVDSIVVTDIEMSEYVRVTHKMVVIPRVIDVDCARYAKSFSFREIDALHCPSREAWKGTGQIQAALAGKLGHVIVKTFANKQKFYEMLGNSRVYIDQTIIDSPGVAGLEALAYGCVLVSAVNKRDFGMYTSLGLPMINIREYPTLEMALNEAWNVASEMESSHRDSVSNDAFRKMHSSETVCNQWKNVL